MFPHIWSCMTAHRLRMRFWVWGEVLTVVLWWGNNFISNHDIVRVLRNRPNFSINYSISQTIMVKIFGQFLVPFPLFLNVEFLNAFFSKHMGCLESKLRNGGRGRLLRVFPCNFLWPQNWPIWAHSGSHWCFWDILRLNTQKPYTKG